MKNRDSGVQQQGLRQHLAYIFMSCLRRNRRPEPELLWRLHTPNHVLLGKERTFFLAAVLCGGARCLQTPNGWEHSESETLQGTGKDFAKTYL